MRGQRWDALLARMPAGAPLRVAEVGVWKGALSARLLASRPLLQLWMIDRWRSPREGDTYKGSGSLMAELPQERFDQAKAVALQSVRQFGARAHVVDTPSRDAAVLFQHGTFDLVFLDADHSYRGVCMDIASWLSRVKVGGWLCGHDWSHHGRNDVERAVVEMLGRLHVTLDAGNTWFYRRED